MLSSFITLNDWLHTKAIHSTSWWPRTQQIHRWLSIYCSSIIVQSAVTYYFIKISQRPNASTNAGFERNSMPIQWHKTLNGRKVLENRCSFVDAGFKFLAPRGRFLADCGLSFDVIWNQLPSSSLADVKPSSKKAPAVMRAVKHSTDIDTCACCHVAGGWDWATRARFTHWTKFIFVH